VGDMPFPFSLRGKIKLRKYPPNGSMRESLKNEIDSALIQLLAETTFTDSSNIKFKFNFVKTFFKRWSNWHLLIPLSSGEIIIGKEDDLVVVRYHLYFFHMLIITILMVAILGLATVNERDLLFHNKFYSLAAIWLWLFGGNYILTAFRFPRFLRKCASESIRHIIGAKKIPEDA
jgi:hypothetical protein